jgi:hypothetical protein
VCVCVYGDGMALRELLDIAAGESGRDENEIRRGEKRNATGGTLWPCLGDTRGLELPPVHGAARGYLYRVVTINNLD